MKRLLPFFMLMLSYCSYSQCTEPWVLSVSDIGMTSASITLIELGTATSWQVVVQAPDSGYPDPANAYTATNTFGWPIPSEALTPVTS